MVNKEIAKITYYSEDDAFYLRFAPEEEKIFETLLLDIPNGGINVDINKDGKIVGIEILELSRAAVLKKDS